MVDFDKTGLGYVIIILEYTLSQWYRVVGPPVGGLPDHMAQWHYLMSMWYMDGIKDLLKIIGPYPNHFPGEIKLNFKMLL